MSFKKPTPQSPTPDFEPIPGTLPKTFPNAPEPIAGPGQPQRPIHDDDAAPARSASGAEDPLVESGLPDNDPEQPRETDEEKSIH